MFSEWAASTCSPSTSKPLSSSVRQSGTTHGQGYLFNVLLPKENYRFWLQTVTTYLCVWLPISHSGSCKALTPTVTLKDSKLSVSNLFGLPPHCTRWEDQSLSDLTIGLTINLTISLTIYLTIDLNLTLNLYLSLANTGLDVPTQLRPPDGSTQHSPRGGK